MVSLIEAPGHPSTRLQMTDNTRNATRLPTGRPPGSRSIRVLASRHSHAAIRVLADVAGSEQAPEADRVRAAELILQHATSRPENSEAFGGGNGA